MRKGGFVLLGLIVLLFIFQKNLLNLKTKKNIVVPTTAPEFVLTGAREKYSFEEITSLLKTPELVSFFMKNNIEYTLKWDKIAGGNEYAPAKIIYERGSGKCVGHAILQCYILEKNGWDAYMIGLSIESSLGHNVCGVKIKDRILVLDNSGKIEGYFNNLSEVADHYTKIGNITKGGSIRTVKASTITKTLIDRSVFDLPWELH